MGRLQLAIRGGIAPTETGGTPLPSSHGSKWDDRAALRVLLARDHHVRLVRAGRAGGLGGTSVVDRGETVSYLGSFLMAEDEVVLCRFAGSEPAARRVAECRPDPVRARRDRNPSPLSR